MASALERRQIERRTSSAESAALALKWFRNPFALNRLEKTSTVYFFASLIDRMKLRQVKTADNTPDSEEEVLVPALVAFADSFGWHAYFFTTQDGVRT